MPAAAAQPVAQEAVVQAEPIVTTAVAVAEPAPLPVAVPTPVVAAEPPPQIVAAPVADPIIVPPAPKPAPVDLSGSLQQAGLVMIETSHAAPAADTFAPAQPLGRKPKPAAVIVNEPLQMVETKNN